MPKHWLEGQGIAGFGFLIRGLLSVVFVFSAAADWDDVGGGEELLLLPPCQLPHGRRRLEDNCADRVALGAPAIILEIFDLDGQGLTADEVHVLDLVVRPDAPHALQALREALLVLGNVKVLHELGFPLEGPQEVSLVLLAAVEEEVQVAMWQRRGRVFAVEPRQGEIHEAPVEICPEWWHAVLRFALCLASESGVEEYPDVLGYFQVFLWVPARGGKGSLGHELVHDALGVRLVRLQCHEVQLRGDVLPCGRHNAIEDVPLGAVRD